MKHRLLPETMKVRGALSILASATAVTALAAITVPAAPGVGARAVVAADTPLTPEQTLNRWSIGDVEFSPDATRLAYTATEPVKGVTRARFIFLLDVASGAVRQLTFTGKDFSPRWSPDGRTIAFLSGRDSDRERDAQLYLLPMQGGGEAQRLVDRKETVTTFRWSPDCRRIALLMNEEIPEADQKRQRDRDDGRVVDKADRRPRLWVLDVATKALAQIPSSGWRIDQLEWLPAGDRLVVAATPTPEADRWTARVYSIEPAHPAASFTEIAAPRGPIGMLSVSPDGSTLAYVGARVDGPEAHDLFLQPIAAGAPRNITGETLDRPISQPRWIDNRTLLAHVARGFASSLVVVESNGRTLMHEDLAVNASTFARASDGTIAYVGETTARAPELYVLKAGAPPKAVSSLNRQWASTPVVAPEFLKYTSFDGRAIEAALLANVQSRRMPLVVLVHGGPTGRWSDAFEPWGQLLAARGYAVLYPNVRGSVGYGESFAEMNRADWGGGDFKDVMAGVDAMIARGIADPDRLGIGGWSYGGYMAAWAVTQTNRFKAAVSGAPVIDMASEFGTETGPQYDEWFYGTPYERLDGFIKSSPITYVKNAKTPTLLLQGEDDTTDPIGQSQQFYRGLKRYGVESELVLYPREPHGLREEKHLLDRLNRIVAWYDKYLKPPAAATAQR